MKPEIISDSISNIGEGIIDDYFEAKSNPREILKKRKNINRPLLCLIILVLPAVILAVVRLLVPRESDLALPVAREEIIWRDDGHSNGIYSDALYTEWNSLCVSFELHQALTLADDTDYLAISVWDANDLFSGYDNDPAKDKKELMRIFKSLGYATIIRGDILFLFITKEAFMNLNSISPGQCYFDLVTCELYYGIED